MEANPSAVTGRVSHQQSLPAVRSVALRGKIGVERSLPASRIQTTRNMATFGRILGRSVAAGGPAATGAAQVSGDNPGGSLPFATMMNAVARSVGIDRSLLAAVVDSESSFNPRAVSPVGAKGLMQLMAGTAQSMGVSDVFDPSQNLMGGAKYLKGLLDRYGGSLPLALAAYNAGPGAVDRYQGIPPYAETQTYVQRVLAAVQRYQRSGWGRDAF
jgi:soluble lytic murein transglycosylase-like protein